MNIVFCAVALFILAFFIHLFIWRIQLPKNHTKALLWIFFGTFVGGIFILWRLREIKILWDFLTGYEYLNFVFLFISLALAYIVTYSAIEVDSPSLLIVRGISETGSKGMSKEELNRIMTDDLLVKPRVEDLVGSRMVYLDGDKYKLTTTGTFVARIFLFFRKLLNAQKGG